jgi:hypothetical protein
MKIAILSLTTVALAGCVTSPVAPLGDGAYTVSMQTSFGVTTRSAMQGKLIDEATAYCAKEGKLPLLRNSVSSGVPGLTNVGATIVFSCVQMEPSAAAGR